MHLSKSFEKVTRNCNANKKIELELNSLAWNANINLLINKGIFQKKKET